jgi:hypothetical protein
MDTKALSLCFASEGLMINGKVRPRTGHENFWGGGDNRGIVLLFL